MIRKTDTPTTVIVVHIKKENYRIPSPPPILARPVARCKSIGHLVMPSSPRDMYRLASRANYI